MYPLFMPSKSTVPITIRVTPEVLASIDEDAETNEVTRSKMAYRLIKRGLRRDLVVQKMDAETHEVGPCFPEEVEENE